ncbi:MAG: bifunctional hydroxymethylpyrimidine kinase/phosphomethylpyrimidine kinase [Halobacteriota archaeon]
MRITDKRVMTIGGSDCSGGAGIQADIKTFSALGVYGTSVLTAVTAQNSLGVQNKQELHVELVKSQFESIIGDMSVNYAKTGMLYSAAMTETVTSLLKKYCLPFVLDPVMNAGAGGVLMERDSVNTLIELLLPVCQVITPNVPEANAISGLEIKTVADAKEAAVTIHALGAPVVIITGGHLEREIGARKATDLIYDGEFQALHDSYVNLRQGRVLHGAGCSFSAALAAELAKGENIRVAAAVAKRFVHDAITHGDVVSGLVVVSQAYRMREDAERYYVLEDVKEAVRMMKAMKRVETVIPEVGTNIGMAIERAESEDDVAAVDGRIRPMREGINAGSVDFGMSSHVARLILAMMKHDSGKRSAINVKYTPELTAACKESGLVVASFERAKEPVGEGEETMAWGVKEAVRNLERNALLPDERGVRKNAVPDVIFDLGAVGKEPMVRIFGNTAVGVVLKLRKIMDVLGED